MITPLVASDYAVYSMSLARLLYLTIYVQECIFTQSLYVKIADYGYVSVLVILLAHALAICISMQQKLHSIQKAKVL